jgi:hypothetical protein
MKIVWFITLFIIFVFPLYSAEAEAAPLPQSEPVSYQVKFLSSVNMDVIVKEDTERFIARSRKLFFVGLKAAFHQSYNGANGDETVINRSYSF